MISLTLKEAIKNQIDAFNSQSKNFSAFDITSELRKDANAGKFEIPECIDKNCYFQNNIKHDAVKNIFLTNFVNDPASGYTFDRTFDNVGGFYRYSVTNSPNNVPAPTTPSTTDQTTDASSVGDVFSKLFNDGATVTSTPAPQVQAQSASGTFDPVKARINFYLTRCKAKNFNPNLKQVQSAIKVNGVTCAQIQTIVNSLNWVINPDQYTSLSIVKTN